MAPMTRMVLPVLALLGALGGCTPSYSPDTYNGGSVQQASRVEQGVIVGVRQVGVQASGTTGAVVGGAAGGIAGSQAPIGGVGTALSTLGGTLVGGLVGTGVERATGDTTAYEYVVRKANNELVSVTQKDRVPLPPGQRVLVIAGPQARIVADYIVPPDPAAPLDEARRPEAKPAVPEVKPAVPAPSFTPIL